MIINEQDVKNEFLIRVLDARIMASKDDKIEYLHLENDYMFDLSIVYDNIKHKLYDIQKIAFDNKLWKILIYNYGAFDPFTEIRIDPNNYTVVVSIDYECKDRHDKNVVIRLIDKRI